MKTLRYVYLLCLFGGMLVRCGSSEPSTGQPDLVPKTQTCSRPLLKKGDRGTHVRFAQQRLLTKGNPYSYGTPACFIRTSGGADGHFGTGTYNAVLAFQRIVFPGQPREWDGIIGSKTWAKLGCGGMVPSVDTASYDDVAQVACHNCYETKYADTFFSTLNGTRVVEIDFRDTRFGTVNTSFPGKWFVSHFRRGGSGNNNNCTGNGQGTNDLEACLKDVLNWSNHNPNHDVITVYLDKKQNWSGVNEGRRPADLDALLNRIFSNKIYKPSDLKRTHPSLREAAHRGWPSMNMLKGKIIFVLTGDNSKLHEYVQDRQGNAKSFVAARANEANDVNGLPNDFNRTTAKWVVFFNIKSGDENRGGSWLADIRRKNYVSRIWNGDDISFCKRVDLGLSHAAYHEYRKQSCNGKTRVVLGN